MKSRFSLHSLFFCFTEPSFNSFHVTFILLFNFCFSSNCVHFSYFIYLYSFSLSTFPLPLSLSLSHSLSLSFFLALILPPQCSLVFIIFLLLYKKKTIILPPSPSLSFSHPPPLFLPSSSHDEAIPFVFCV